MHHELPGRVDLDYYRKVAKELARDYRSREPQAVERVEGVLGARARERFLLSDAQYVLARVHGHRSWADFKRFVESARAEPAIEDRFASLRASLEVALATWGERGEVVLDSGLEYGPGEAVEVFVRKRLHRYHFDDRGGATRLAGKEPGWRGVAERVAEERALNVSRGGAVFVGAVEGRDLASLAVRVAETSVAVYTALLDELG